MEVYEPREDTTLLIKVLESRLPDLKKEKVQPLAALELGCGSGVVVKVLAQHCSPTVAIDINPLAIKETMKLLQSEGLQATIVHGDLYTPLKYGDSDAPTVFDIIVSNPPYLPNEEQAPDIALDGGRIGNEITKKIIEGFNEYLAIDGHAFLIVCSLSEPEHLHELLQDLHFEWSIVDELKVSFETLWVYEITKRQF